MGETETPIDFANRDPNSLHSGLGVAFEEVFGEPDTNHSPECAWNCTYKCYNGARKCCYATLTVLCGWFHGLCWGCEFACLAFTIIYNLTPSLRVTSILCTTLSNLFSTLINCCLAPVCAALGMFFSNIKVQQG